MVSLLRRFVFKTAALLVPELHHLKDIQRQMKGTAVNTLQEDPVKLYPPFELNNVAIGRYTYISRNALISNTTIGRFCSIGPNLVCGWGVHPLDGISTSPMFYSTKKQNGYTFSSTDKIQERKPIKIGNDVFIGMNVTILDGITIGDGAVIGAGCVVSKDVSPYAVVAGNPMRILRYRFSDEIITDLKTLQWWNGNDMELKKIEEYFFNPKEYLKLKQMPIGK